ncbi:MAG: GGDEF domain-containing protein [Planctomycetota bacterium]
MISSYDKLRSPIDQDAAAELRGVVLADVATDQILAISPPLRSWLDEVLEEPSATLGHLVESLECLEGSDAAVGNQRRIRIETADLIETGQRALVLTVGARSSGGSLPCDALTGLPTRQALAEEFAAWRATPEAARRPCAVLFVDLDGFKQVNDRLGHVAGDAVLREVATRLAGAIRGEDLVVRYGGDEFAVFVREVTETTDLDAIVARLKRQISAPLDQGNGSFTVSASVGVAVAFDGSTGLEELLDEADAAMYAVKRSAQSSCRQHR